MGLKDMFGTAWSSFAGSWKGEGVDPENITWRKTQVAILCCINIVNYMDRYTVSGVLSLMFDDIDFGMGCNPETDDNDCQGDDDGNTSKGGLLQTAFIICYFLSAPLFGYLGDRYSRKWLMVLGMLAWSTCTLIATFMPTYWPLLAFRSAIGFGEAGFTSIAPTVIGDLYGEERRGIVLALFYFAIPVGSGLGYIVGGVLAEIFEDWRWGLRATPILNAFALVFLILFGQDPKRGHMDSGAQKVKDEEGSKSDYWDDIIYLFKNKSFMLTTIAFTCLTFCTGALSWWGPYYVLDAIELRNSTGLDSAITEEVAVSFMFGLILSVTGVLGLIAGSGLSYLLRGKFPWIDPVICGGGLLLSAPFLISGIATAAEGIVVAFLLIFFGEIFLNMNWAVIVDISLYVVVPHRRASAEAFQLTLAHALGEAGSPYICSLIADAFNEHLRSLNSTDNIVTNEEADYYSYQYSLFITIAFEIIGGIIFLWATFYVVSDKRKVEEFQKEALNEDTGGSPSEMSGKIRGENPTYGAT